MIAILLSECIAQHRLEHEFFQEIRILIRFNTLYPLASLTTLPTEEAWHAITINPATLTGIGDRVGSLEIGKDGDVVIWTADPITTVGAAAHTTVVDGKVVYCAE